MRSLKGSIARRYGSSHGRVWGRDEVAPPGGIEGRRHHVADAAVQVNFLQRVSALNARNCTPEVFLVATLDEASGDRCRETKVL